ncbi:hypothetical protein GGI42DRAFT_333267 [Trichoderma sp. SZMC 28013]
MALHSCLHLFSLWASQFTMSLPLYFWGFFLWPAPVFHPAILAALLGCCISPSVSLPTRLPTVFLCVSVEHSLLLFFPSFLLLSVHSP